MTKTDRLFWEGLHAIDETRRHIHDLSLFLLDEQEVPLPPQDQADLRGIMKRDRRVAFEEVFPVTSPNPDLLYLRFATGIFPKQYLDPDQ